VGSLFFCRSLLQARLVPRPLAILGLIGYSVLAVGGILELFGYGVGLVFSIPGGLFELVLGVLLIARGVRPMTDSSAEGVRGGDGTATGPIRR
jgi:hypothetical protein